MTLPAPADRWTIELANAARTDAIASFGVTERQARFLLQVLLHAGVFVERQYCAYAGIVHGQKSTDFIKALIEQRFATILRVAQAIVRRQRHFLDYGELAMKPLGLREIADELGLHESTVSRVTNNKYMATPAGVFELKYFFTSAISAADDGEAYSSEAVRFRIKQLIDGEASHLVLSDDKIVDILRDDGIDIARRTVAKYREAMRIPSSVQRRREKRLSGCGARAS